MSATKLYQGLLGLLCLSVLGCPGSAVNRVEDYSDFEFFEFQQGWPMFSGDVLAGATIQRQADGQYQFEAALLTVNPPEPGEVRDADGLLLLPPRILTEDEVARMRLTFSHIEMHAASGHPCYTDQVGYSFRWDDFEATNSNCTTFGDQIVNDPSIEEISQMLDDFWHAGG